MGGHRRWKAQPQSGFLIYAAPGKVWGMKRLLAAVLALLLPLHAHAGQLVLDSEFTHYCQTLAKPLLPNLPHTSNVSYVLVADDALNAFVDGEQVVHVHSGLFLNAKGSGDIQGVLGHELGHVASQHLLQMYGEQKTSLITGLAGAAVGIGAAIAGAPQVAAAAITTGQAGAIAQMLRFTRTHEREADQRAIAALHAAGLSAQGMVNTFERLRLDSQLSYGSVPPYLMTHPLPQDRLQSLQRAVAVEKQKPPPDNDPAFQRMSAKVYALSHTGGQTLRHYMADDDASRYARVYAYASQGKLAQAEQELAPLLKASPTDAFYIETAAQLAREKGDLATAEALFTKVVKAHPELAQPYFELAELQRAQGNLSAAQQNLTRATNLWPVWADPWRSLGLVYGQQGKLPMSHLALAQSGLLGNADADPRGQYNIAMNYLAKTPDAEAQAWAEALKPKIDDLPK